MRPLLGLCLTLLAHGALAQAGLVERSFGVRPAPSFDQRPPGIVFDGEAFALVWSELGPDGGSDLWATRLFLDGGQLPPLVVGPTRDDQLEPSIGSNGQRSLVAWTNQVQTTRAQFFTKDFVSQGPVFPIGDGTDYELHPEVVWRGDVFAITYADSTPAAAAKLVTVTDLGVVSPVLEVQRMTFVGPPRVSLSGSSLLVASRVEGPGNADVGARLVSSQGTVGPPLEVGRLAGDDFDPAVASEGSDSLVAWTGFLGAQNYLVRANFVRSGQVISSDAFDIGPGRSPSVAFDGSRYRVVFEEVGALSGSIGWVAVTRSGNVEALPPLGITGSAPRLVWTADAGLLTWIAANDAGLGQLSARLWTPAVVGLDAGSDAGESGTDGGRDGGDASLRPSGVAGWRLGCSGASTSGPWLLAGLIVVGARFLRR